MKLFFIREKDTPYGGAENYLKRLCNSNRISKYDAKIIRSPFSMVLPSWFRVLAFNIYLCFIKKDKFYFSLERIICPDIYRAGDGVHKVFIQKIEKSLLNPLHFLYLIIEKKCFKNAKIIIANSEMVKKEIIESYSIDRDKIKVIYNGINLESKKIQCTNQSSQIDPFLIKNKKLILFVGNGFKRKGLDNFLEIMSRLNKDLFYGLIIGSDKNEHLYKQKAEKMKVLDHVKFLGNRKDVNIFYDKADFVILPTKYDPFSNVVLEAMYYHNIVVTTRQNGAHEVLDSQWVMKDSNDYKIVDKIEEISSNKTLLRKNKEINYLKSLNFSIELNAEKTAKLIESIE